MQKKNIRFIVFIAIFCIFLSGCDVNYTLALSVLPNYPHLETIEISDGRIDNYSLDNIIKGVRSEYGMYYNVNYIEDLYDDCYFFGDGAEADCNFDMIEKTYGISLSKRYYDIKKFTDSKAITDYFGKLDISNSGNIYTFKASADEALGSLITDVNFISALVHNVNINIVVPFEVESHNADSVSLNTYTWTFNKDNYKTKSIQISYDSSKSFMGDEIENNTNSNQSQSNINPNTNNKEKEESNNLWMILGIIFGGIVVIGLAYFITKKNNNNAI